MSNQSRDFVTFDTIKAPTPGHYFMYIAKARVMPGVEYEEVGTELWQVNPRALMLPADGQPAHITMGPIRSSLDGEVVEIAHPGGPVGGWGAVPEVITGAAEA